MSDSSLHHQDALVSKQMTILESISQLDQSTDVADKDKELIRLKLEYNGLVTQITVTQPNPLRDPMQVLIPEIWENILLMSANDFNRGYPKFNVEQILEYTLVSLRWQQNIINTPKFWARIYVADDVEDLEAKVETSLHLSKNYPLSLLLGSDFKVSWRNVGSRIATHGFRLRSISVDAAATVSLNEIVVFQLFEDLGALETVDITYPKPELVDLEPLLRKARSIRSLLGLCTSLDTLQLEQMKLVRTLTIREDLSQALPISQQLRYLKFVTVLPQLASQGEENLTMPEPSDPLIPLSWESLSISQSLTLEFWGTVLNRTGPSLVALSMQISWLELSGFLTLCNSAPSLRTLILVIFDIEKEFKGSFQFTSVSSIETLDLCSIWRFHHLAPSRPIEYFYEHLTLWAPYVRDFKIQTNVAMSSLFSYILSLTHLKHCSLDIDSLDEHVQVHTEGLTFTGLYSNFARVSSLSVSSLQLHLFGPSEIGMSFSERWKNVSDLTITVDFETWKGALFPNVRRLRLELDVDAGLQRDILPSLCQEMAEYPGIFPMLQKLEIDGYPEWDIVFIMLERRNCTVNTNWSPINSLSFPFTLPYIITDPLTKLLRGEFPTQSNYYPFSLRAQSDAYFDSAIPGCLMCHLSLKFCSYPVFISSTGISPPLDLPKYPSTSAMVLQTRPNRFLEWMKADDTKGFTRGFVCRPKPREYFEVTEYSLHGSNMVDSIH